MGPGAEPGLAVVEMALWWKCTETAGVCTDCGEREREGERGRERDS